MSDVLEYGELMPADIARAVVDPHAYGKWDDWHAKMKTLRATQPFARGSLPGYDRFWVASKFHDIQEITRQPQLFLSGFGPLEPAEQIAMDAAKGVNARSVVFMNAPEHMKYRLLTQSWFQPKSIRKIEDQIRQLARSYIGKMRDLGSQCDFWDVVAKRYSLHVIMSILGIPPEHEAMMLNIAANHADACVDVEPEDLATARLEMAQKAWEYFGVLTEKRRTNPVGDLASVIANGRIDGEPLNKDDTSYYFITILIAGHDTTSASLSGGIWALAENPAQLAKVKADPGLIDNLVDESVRWTTPIYQFGRTASQDTEFRDARIKAGDRIILNFLSANRDEDVFEDPFAFRVDRSDARHVGFSHGAHMCLGMHLARMEMRILFEELLPCLRSLELAGEPRRRLTSFVGGPEHLPIRYTLD